VRSNCNKPVIWLFLCQMKKLQLVLIKTSYSYYNVIKPKICGPYRSKGRTTKCSFIYQFNFSTSRIERFAHLALSRICLNFKVLPFKFYVCQDLFKAFFTSYIFQQGIVFGNKRIIDPPFVKSLFQPFKRFLFLTRDSQSLILTDF
jgi:hypothetical protein